MNEITRRLFQLALSGKTLRANTGFYKYLNFPRLPGCPGCTISVSEDGWRPQDITNDTSWYEGRAKKHSSLQQVYLLLLGVCVVRCGLRVVAGGVPYALVEFKIWKH